MKHLRIIFTILCAICIAALFPLGMILGWGPAGYCLLGAFLFFGLMLLCKQSQEAKEAKEAREKPSQDEATDDTATDEE